MQAQDSGFDWSHLLTWSLGIIGGGISGVVGGAWRWSRAIDKRVNHVREELKADIAAKEKAAEVRLDDLVDQFKETFHGLRRQLDQDRLDAERRYLSKDDFKDFLTEYRSDRADQKSDFRDLKENISRILGERT